MLTTAGIQIIINDWMQGKKAVFDKEKAIMYVSPDDLYSLLAICNGYETMAKVAQARVKYMIECLFVAAKEEFNFRIATNDLISSKQMKIAIIIPDRNDRPQLLANCLRMMQAQTLQPAHIELVDYAPLSDAIDITQRYRIGYERLQGRDVDLIAFIENDDYYHPSYLEYMAMEWQLAGQPDLFGTNHSIYYHLGLRKYYTMQHYSRASACNTFIKPGLQITWPPDNEAYTDMHLWHKLRGSKKTITPDGVYSIGIKHGIGRIGGQRHNTGLEQYNPKGTTSFEANKHTDGNFEFLKTQMDAISYQFYTTLIVPKVTI